MRAELIHHQGKLTRKRSGLSLMECVLALAMISFALPGVLMVLAHSRSNAESVNLQSDAGRILMRHADELMRDGQGLEDTLMVWAYDSRKQCLGRVDESADESGLSDYDGRAVRYLVIARSDLSKAVSPQALHLTFEYPSAAPRKHRQRFKLHTQL